MQGGGDDYGKPEQSRAGGGGTRFGIACFIGGEEGMFIVTWTEGAGSPIRTKVVNGQPLCHSCQEHPGSDCRFRSSKGTTLVGRDDFLCGGKDPREVSGK